MLMLAAYSYIRRLLSSVTKSTLIPLSEEIGQQVGATSHILQPVILSFTKRFI